jgi:hypothetical protein
MFTGKLGIVLGTGLLLSGCDGARAPIDPTPVSGATPTTETAAATAGPASAASAVSTPDVNGTWNWSEEVTLALPEWLGPVFGFAPEGPITHMRCQDSGVMTITQTGASFSGTATQVSTCQTRGGQVFAPAVFPPALEIADGHIEGRSVHMLFGPPPTEVPAPYVGSITQIVGGVATEMRGTGLAIVPGHPKSPLFFDPPAPPTKTIDWQARRP